VVDTYDVQLLSVWVWLGRKTRWNYISENIYDTWSGWG
jgi:hypothetical protein